MVSDKHLSSTDPFIRLGIASDQYTPIRGWALVKRLPEDERFGALFVPKQGETRRRRDTSMAEVIKVGTPELAKSGAPIPIQVLAGERVLIDKFAGHDIAFTDGTFLIIDPVRDILLIVDSD